MYVHRASPRRRSTLPAGLSWWVVGLAGLVVFSIAIAAAVAFFYGGMIWGILPGLPQVSWEGHLSGLLGGVLAARMLEH